VGNAIAVLGPRSDEPLPVSLSIGPAFGGEAKDRDCASCDPLLISAGNPLLDNDRIIAIERLGVRRTQRPMQPTGARSPLAKLRLPV
jgi:hypothetical protein